jgi:hypothetical protein
MRRSPGLSLLLLRRWKSPFRHAGRNRFDMLAGVWLALSPFRLGYGDPLRIVHVVIGALVVILSAVELWRSAKT